ncbi:hypothetical protein TPA0909_20440 [Streptomyces albus]|nr:hypothetical protein TPA0909_20440 [Streptomyces albus]
MPQDGESVIAGDLDGLDDLSVGELVGQVPEFTVDTYGDHGAVTLEERGGRSARRHHALFPLGIALDGHTGI